MLAIIGFLALFAIGVGLWVRQEVRADRAKKAEDDKKRKQPSPCGDDETHYHWTIEHGFPCPNCCALSRIKREADKQRQLARMIAEEVTGMRRGGV